MTINCKGRLVDLKTPKVMGILNITPDSFFDGGKYKTDKDILLQTEKMLNNGATFIDVGAYSSRPNAKHITEQEELNRLLPVIELLVRNFENILISADTFRATIATKSIEAGACMINDISGGEMDKNMFKTIAKLQVPYILMHMKGTPQNMQTKPEYDDVVNEIYYYFSKKIKQLYDLKVNDVILDIGFGFGKTISHNYEILKKLHLFNDFKLPLLVGLSRKSMLYKLLEGNPENMLNATSVVNTIAILNGANILRVHDVKEAVETIKITNQIM
jgi:dihydropteroate synthase